MSFIISFDGFPPLVFCKEVNNVALESFSTFTRSRRKVHAIISYAMYCFSSSCIFLGAQPFLLLLTVLEQLYYLPPSLLLTHNLLPYQKQCRCHSTLFLLPKLHILAWALSSMFYFDCVESWKGLFLLR
jgi:hypothetical protein